MLKEDLLRAVFYIPVKILGACHYKKENLKSSIKLDDNKRVCYVMQSNSISDMLTLEKLTRAQRLPNPFSYIELDGHKIPRTTYMKKVNWIFSGKAKDYNFEKTFREWILYTRKTGEDLQIIPVSIFWGRNPGHVGEPYKDPINRPRSIVRKFLRVLFLGLDNLTVLSEPISLSKMISKYSDDKIIHQLASHTRADFENKHLEFIGPRLPNRQYLIQELLQSDNIKETIKQISTETGKNYSEIESDAYAMLDEILADISYSSLRFTSILLHLVWNKLYQGITIKGATQVHDLIRKEHEIIYVPCHRSHMDYLLLFYALFNECLVVPHVVAGNNLNFFPINRYLRACGAFFMRRKFKGDKLYTAVFREYIHTLCAKGYSIEFFIEGGRSRTGRTLPPRTGLVSMAVQNQLISPNKPITFVPIYLGYEKVLEVNSYMDELTGTKQKEKESFWQLFNIYKRFKYYGRGYISFGDPVTINDFLDQNAPTWKQDSLGITANSKPSWLFDTVNQLSDQIIINLNASAAINGLNLSALAILSAHKHTLSIRKLHEVVNFYLQVLKSSSAIKQDIIPETPGQILLHQAMELHPFHIEKIDGEKYAKPNPKQIIYLTYFRNNIQHFFVLPALIATIVMVHKKICYKDIIVHTRNVFYFLRHELFSPISEDILDQTISDYLKSFKLAEYIRTEDDMYFINKKYSDLMGILSSCIYLNLIRYLLAVKIISAEKDNTITIKDFIDRCVQKSKELPVEITDNSPEFSDPITFRVMSETFIRHQYIFIAEENAENTVGSDTVEKSASKKKKIIPGTIKKNIAKLQKLVNAVGPLLPSNLRYTVK